MGNVLSPKKEEVKGGEVNDGPIFDFINLHLPSAGGAIGVVVAIGLTLLLVWVLVKKCKRHDRAARVKNLRDLRNLGGGGGRADLEMANFEMGPMSPLASPRPMMFPSPHPQGFYPSPLGNFANQLALGWNPSPTFNEPKAHRTPRRFQSSRIKDVTEEDERQHSAAPSESVGAQAETSRVKRETASGNSDRWRPDEYDWDD